jgi:hypothetical protein
MSDNVISVFGGAIGKQEPIADCVTCLEKYLEMARSGKIQGVAMVAMDSDNVTEYAIAGHVGGFSVIGALQVVQQHLIDFTLEVE